MKRFILCITVVLVVSLSSLVSASTIYQNDFSAGDTTGWSSNKISPDDGTEKLLGLFGAFSPDPKPYPWAGEKVELVLASAGAGQYSVQFDLFTINTWDGGFENGPDTISFSINNLLVFSGWFSSGGSNSAGLTVSGTDILTFFDNGHNAVGNQRYSPTFNFYHGGGDLTFSFLGMPNQPEQLNGDTGFYDEPWALDNVVVSTVAAVPEPTTMLLLGIGLVGIAGMRRKMQR